MPIQSLRLHNLKKGNSMIHIKSEVQQKELNEAIKNEYKEIESYLFSKEYRARRKIISITQLREELKTFVYHIIEINDDSSVSVKLKD